MKHFIITRFGYPKDYEHLEERIALFNSFTLPSIKAQTNQNFEWLLLGDQLFDIPGARWFGDQPVEAKEHLCPGHLNDSYLRYIKTVTKKENLVLMTRLDNDDILMPTFVADVQATAKLSGFKTPGLIDFRGYRLDISLTYGPRWQNKFYQDILYHKEFTSPMVTLVQNKVRDTIYRRNHAMMARFFPVTYVEKPNWVQVVHGDNWLQATFQTRKWSKEVTTIHPFVKKLMEEHDAKNS